MLIYSSIGNSFPTQVSGSSTSYRVVTLAGSLIAKIGVVTPRIVRPKQAVTANRGIDGSGLRKSSKEVNRSFDSAALRSG